MQTRTIPEFMVDNPETKFKFLAVLDFIFSDPNGVMGLYKVCVKNLSNGHYFTAILSPELLRKRYRIGHTYANGNRVDNDEDLIDVFTVDTSTFNGSEQKRLSEVVSESDADYLLDKSRNYKKYFLMQYCYVFNYQKHILVIPVNSILLHFYYRSSSMKVAAIEGMLEQLYESSELKIEPNDARIMLSRKAAESDAPFIYRFASSKYSRDAFNDIGNYIANSLKKIGHFETSVTMKAKFPIKESFSVKAIYKVLPTEIDSRQVLYVTDILNDDSSLGFNNLTILKQSPVKPSDNAAKNLLMTTKTPASISSRSKNNVSSSQYGTNKLSDIILEKNWSLNGRSVIKSKIDTNLPQSIIINEKSDDEVSLGIAHSKSNSTTKTIRTTLTTIEEAPKKIYSFEEFINIVKYIEKLIPDCNIFVDTECKTVPIKERAKGILFSRCSIDNRPLKYMTASMNLDGVNVVLLEIEQSEISRSMWMIASHADIGESDIDRLLREYFIKERTIQFMQKFYNGSNGVRFSTKNHPLNMDDNILQSWLKIFIEKIKLDKY